MAQRVSLYVYLSLNVLLFQAVIHIKLYHLLSKISLETPMQLGRGVSTTCPRDLVMTGYTITSCQDAAHFHRHQNLISSPVLHPLIKGQPSLSTVSSSLPCPEAASASSSPINLLWEMFCVVTLCHPLLRS